MPPSSDQIVLDGSSLRVEDVIKVARSLPGEVVVSLSDHARDATNELRRYLEAHWLTDDAPAMYGINTGLGKLKDSRISAADLDRFQHLIINSHSSGVGPPIPIDEARALLMLRVNALAKGVSGLRVECLDRLLEMLNRGVHPVVPSQGSVGASGDLAPCAHVVAVMIGHEQAEAFFGDERMPAAEALTKAGMEPSFELRPKDVIAMINGSTLSLATSVLGLHDALVLTGTADIALGLSMEAMRAELAAFDDRIHAARNSEAQRRVAANTRKIVADSRRTTEDSRAERLPDEYRPTGDYHVRVQDAYSIRCAPQVHGAARDLLASARELLEREMNAATDNPLIFSDGDGGYQVLSGGNFHGQPIAYAADMIAMAVAELGSISERRCYRLTDPTMSYGLPLNLVGGTLGLNTGFSLVHCAAAALTSENKVYCFPASVDTVPTKANQEDHVSMSTHAATKMRRIVANSQAILGIELVCASQGIDLSAQILTNRALGVGTQIAWDLIRTKIPATGEDQFQSPHLASATELVASEQLLRAVEATVGELV